MRRVVLITGAGGGIGRETAMRFATDGCDLVMADLFPDPLADAASHVRAAAPDTRVIEVVCDVSQEASILALREAVDEAYGRIDVLALIAGVVQEAAAVTELSTEHWDEVFAANLRGPYLCAKHLVPLMVRDGAIVTIASWWGEAGHAFFSAYCASKAGVKSLTQCLAAELAPLGIRANCVAPGNIDTGMHREALRVEAEARGMSFDELKAIEWAKIPLGIAGPPRSIADAAAFLASPHASYITGATLDVNGGVMFN